MIDVIKKLFILFWVLVFCFYTGITDPFPTELG